jgi:hypothetical protein
MACAVLGCPNDASRVLVVSAPGTVLQEAPICAAHMSEIDSGAAWECVFEDGKSVVLMGDDATPRLGDWGTEELGASSEAGAGLTLTLDLVRRRETLDTLRVRMTYQEAVTMGEWLTQRGRSATQGG